MTSLNSSNYLIIDTSEACKVWFFFKGELEKTLNLKERPSVVLFESIHQILDEYSLDIREIERFYFCKGPGSYTGLRISEGLEQYLRMNKINCSGFYSFEILNLFDSNYCYLSNAFKNEYFFAWKDKDIKYKKIKKEFLEQEIGELEVISSNCLEKTYDKFINDKIVDFLNYLKNENKVKEVFYYRSLDEEYKRK